MLKEKLDKTVNRIKFIASISGCCVNAMIDTLTDSEITKAYRAEKHELATINTKLRQEKAAIRKEYKKLIKELDKNADKAKYLAREEFCNTVGAVFDYHFDKYARTVNEKVVE